jgi:hypothetical protein
LALDVQLPKIEIHLSSNLYDKHKLDSFLLSIKEYLVYLQQEDHFLHK